jgi:UDP-N-acetylmuramoylalanine--D-glutamate ligase
MIPVRGFEGKTVAVFGLGRTGLTAARALIAGGADVVLWDDNAEAREAAASEGLPVADLKTADWREFAALMLSPGAPLTHPAPHWTVLKAQDAGVEVLGDILQAAGRDARIGGNIGYGVLGLDDMHGGAVYVLEVSSYQLDLTSSLKADAAVLLNITPDHLDRHGGMDGYVAAKKRVLLNQGKGDTAIIGVDDSYCQQICTEITAANRRTIWPISSGRAMGRGVYALSGVLYDATGDRVVEVADLLRAPGLPGKHNWQNAAAAYAAARALGVSVEDAAAGLITFPGLAHRMETVGQVGKVKFVNDSKATNADAARQAMSTYPKFYWICGGRAKAGGIDSLTDLFPRVERAYVIGEAAETFADILQDNQVQVSMAGTLEAATMAAYADARASGDEAVILLSPACASFDQFPDFEVRGDAFREYVRDIAMASHPMEFGR